MLLYRKGLSLIYDVKKCCQNLFGNFMYAYYKS